MTELQNRSIFDEIITKKLGGLLFWTTLYKQLESTFKSVGLHYCLHETLSLSTKELPDPCLGTLLAMRGCYFVLKCTEMKSITLVLKMLKTKTEKIHLEN